MTSKAMVSAMVSAVLAKDGPKAVLLLEETDLLDSKQGRFLLRYAVAMRDAQLAQRLLDEKGVGAVQASDRATLGPLLLKAAAGDQKSRDTSNVIVKAIVKGGGNDAVVRLARHWGQGEPARLLLETAGIDIGAAVDVDVARAGWWQCWRQCWRR